MDTRFGFSWWVWWGLMFCLLALTLIVIGPLVGADAGPAVSWLIAEERELWIGQLSVDTVLWMISLADPISQAATVPIDRIERWLLSGGQVRFAESLINLAMAGLLAVRRLIGLFALRCAAISWWAICVFPFLVVAVLDGYCEWRKRQYSFLFSSPISHGYGVDTMKFLLVATVALLVVPVPVRVELLLAPILCAAWAQWHILAYAAKRA